MKFGVVFPQNQLGDDPIVIRDFVQAAEEMGYHHLLAYDHVLGANPDREGWKEGNPYTHNDMFHEVFTLFAYLAGLTETIGFMTGVLILPQRQTALVAKQAAQVDVLSKGRLRLGVGVGWNEVEYKSLGSDFKTRGARVEEQIVILRELWTQPLVRIEGEFDTIDDAGINPLPRQQPIPLWIGGTADVVLQRAARIGDGWIAHSWKPEKAQPLVEKYWSYVGECGKADTAGLHTRLITERLPENEWENYVKGWKKLGATELAVYPHGDTLEDYIECLQTFKDMFGV
jgi:probable F420-dependent oxidoreductase